MGFAWHHSAAWALSALILTLSPALLLADALQLDLSAESWQLSSANQSVAVTTTLPAHVLGVLAAAGIVQQDPLYRYGELETRWVSEDTWNFTLIWSGQKHQQMTACRHVMLVLHGVDTYGDVVLNGRHVLHTNNAHRSWWAEVPSDILRDGANMLSVVLHPAVSTALRAKALNRYDIPTMAVPGGFDVYNFARKPASDFGWDWGPAFAPAGITGAVQLVGFNRASIIGALVHLQLVNGTFLLHITAQLLVPADGDAGRLTVQLPQLSIQQQQQVTLSADTVAGNPLQTLAHMQLEVPADQVELWQPRGLLAPGASPALYDVVVSFEPADAAAVSDTGDRSSSSSSSSSSSVMRRIGFRTVELVRLPIQEAAADLMPKDASRGAKYKGGQPADAAAAAAAPKSSVAEAGTWAQVQGLWRYIRKVTDRSAWWYPEEPPGRDWPAPTSTQLETVRSAVQAECNKKSNTDSNTTNSQVTGHDENYEPEMKESKAVSQEDTSTSSKEHDHHHQQQQQCEDLAAAAASSSITGQQQLEEDGESFYFRVNGVPVYAKGANLIPLHVLSSAVTADDVVLLLQSAAAANMNMIRVWGGGLYQVGELYDAADELGLMIWQEAMFACSPYPRDPSFLSNVDHELVHQIMRLGSHPSVVLWGGNNEIEASLEWYEETRSNLALFAVDYDLLFQQTVGRLVQEMLPGIPWVDSSPSNGYITLTHDSNIPAQQGTSPAAASIAGVTAAAAAAAADSTALGSTGVIKRWGNSQNRKYGDVHYYNYRDDCQDWRTYPASRFISEYGWQSYPSWATYRTATEQQDWTLAADMTGYRQRHPNGTIELLAQLSRRFKMPQAWQHTLHQHQQQHQQQQQQNQQQALRCNISDTCDLWRAFCTKVTEGLRNLWQEVMYYASMVLPAHSPSSSSSSSSSTGTRTPDGEDATGQSDSYNEIQHWIYLTQLQQMLCYDTAVSYWRRLRSQADTLNMGVLYWQLNDIWQGASWSSIDYGGVWKPLHYQLSTAFADLALSVQHDIHNNTLQVHVVSDLRESVEAQLTLRLLSLVDSSAACGTADVGSSSNTKSTSSAADSGQQPGRTLQHMQQQQMVMYDLSTTAAAGAAAATGGCKGTWSRNCQTISLHVPARSSVQGFSGSIRLLLAAARGCSSSTCYIHIALQAPGRVSQEATVWLAPFHEMQLPDPKLQVSGFKVVQASGVSTSTSRSNNGLGADSGTAAGGMGPPKVALTLSSVRVAVYTVLELESGNSVPGHFSDNAITVHPCEPRQVRFIPHLGASSWQRYLARLKVQRQQHVKQQGAIGSGQMDEVEDNVLLDVLQQQLLVTSLYDHQRFAPSAS